MMSDNDQRSSSGDLAANDRDPDDGPDGDETPIVLDLSGKGIALTQLTSSNQFVVGEDNYQHRTAPPGPGPAAPCSSSTPTATMPSATPTSTCSAIGTPRPAPTCRRSKDVFDTNHDGKLDAGDADFAQFKLMVTNADGTTSVETLAQAGMTSIDLTANSVAQNFADGSSIDGETTFTKANGSTGTAAR